MEYSQYKLFREKHEYCLDIKDLSSSKVFCPDQTKSAKLNFDFTWKPVVRKWLYDSVDDSFILYRDDCGQCITKCFEFSESSVIGNRETLMKDLKWMPLPKDMIEGAIMYAEEELQTFMQFLGLFKHNFVYMDMEVTHYIDLFYVPRDEMDLVTQRSIEENVRMVPATDVSIRSLERKKVTEFSGESCVICLEDNLAGCEVVSLPCEHVFHGDCIEKWLRTSHYCPVCRFEMPTMLQTSFN